MARVLTRGVPGPAQISVVREGHALVLRPDRVSTDSLDHQLDWRHDHPGPTMRRLSNDVAYLKLSTVKVAEVDD